MNLIKSFAAALTIVFLLSCTEEEAVTRSSPLLANTSNQAATGGGSKVDDLRAALTGGSGSSRRLGTDNFLGDSTASGGGARNLVDVTSDGEITLNLINVPIEEAARAVLGDALGKNYSIKPGVTGSVTLQTTRPLSKKALLETFDTILELNGATMQIGSDLITIVQAGNAPRRISKVGGPGGIGARVVAVPLEFIGTTEMIRLLEPIAGSSVELQPIPKRNILLVSGTRDEISAAIEAVNVFDVDVLKGKSVGLYRVKAAEPEAVVDELNLIFETGDGGALQNVVNFIPSQRLNAVLVVTSRKSYLSEAEKWIRDLDKTAGGAKRRPVVYSLQNRSAVELAPILEGMLDQVAEAEEAPVQGIAKVVADGTKNAIVIWGNDTEQESFARLIHSLDTTPVQVLLEATIAEVSLNDDLDFGLRWFFERGEFSGRFSDASNGSTGANFPGLSFMFQGASTAVTLNALSSITDVNVVSSPSLLVLDNQEALLQIGDEVPIATQQVVDTANANAPVVNTISFRDTGIILKVKPRVSSSGRVVLDIEQEVSSVSSTTTSGIDSPTISQRKITTTVAVDNGQTIALGGLIQESQNKTKSKVPLAGDIPLLGNLFKRKGDKVAKTELLVLITPRVIRNGSEAKSVTAELRGRIQGANGLVRTGIGHQSDAHRIFE
ncbi:general secretion pathway protein D [Litoreibacter meonggei]|uniref:General secretion pathway protein D n=1 Tax=Litoreibacter meonggei TaxID=1049199 RepID=A0A497X780_9RHOB|nr:type II secretion system secretin GspD [Litoreibacter meonggei]RLJ60743.1 general secretion pathway protein D [Litoreibacter meonggei]